MSLFASSAPYGRQRGRALARQVDHVGGGQLHLGGQFVAGDPGRQLRVAGVLGEMQVVEPLQEVAGGQFRRFADRCRPLQIGDRLVRVEGGPLEHRRQEGRIPVIRPDLRHAPRIGDRHERRQILALGAQGVGHPAAHAGKAVQRVAGAHLVLGRPVRVALGRHRVDEAHLIGQFGQMRQQVGDHLAGLPARLEIPDRPDQVAAGSLKRHQPFGARQGRIVQLHQGGLTELIMPEAVDDDVRRQGMVRPGDPPGQRQPPFGIGRLGGQSERGTNSVNEPCATGF